MSLLVLVQQFFTHVLWDSERADLSVVPTKYHHLAEILSKDRALSLPLHRPYGLFFTILSLIQSYMDTK